MEMIENELQFDESDVQDVTNKILLEAAVMFDEEDLEEDWALTVASSMDLEVMEQKIGQNDSLIQHVVEPMMKDYTNVLDHVLKQIIH